MIQLGSVALNGTPRIAVGFADRIRPQLIVDARGLGVDIAELRIDLYSDWRRKYVLNEVKKFKDFSSIATIRSKNEGGKWDGTEKDRLELFRAVMPEVAAVDIELSSEKIIIPVIQLAHEAEKLVIVSFHDFKKTPAIRELEKIIDKAKALGADLVKIATDASSDEDIQRLAGLTLANKSKNIVTIAMGGKGAISRIIFPALGSLITYASLGPSMAPGQLDYRDTFELIRRLYPKFNEEKITALNLLEAV